VPRKLVGKRRAAPTNAKQEAARFLLEDDDGQDGAATMMPSMNGKGRYRMARASCAALLGALAVVSLLAAVQLLTRPQPPPAPGQKVLINGREIHFVQQGERSTGPTVVLESGLGGGSFAWAWVQPRVAQFAHIVAYDRAGLGWSQSSDAPHDADAVAQQLHDLLERIHAPRPYLLVGHSLGGLFVLRFAQRYRDEVGGLVLVDALSPRFSGQVDDDDYRHPWRAVALGDFLANLGLLSFLGISQQIARLPPSARDAADYFIHSPPHWDAMLQEIAELKRSLAQARAQPPLGDLPLIVVSATRDRPGGWAELQRGFASLSHACEWRLPPGTDHFGLVTDASQSIYTVGAIRDMYLRMLLAHPRLPLSGALMASGPR
jgi:pimeloyl-ACP methyl ester carboxylesterase